MRLRFSAEVVRLAFLFRADAEYRVETAAATAAFKYFSLSRDREDRWATGSVLGNKPRRHSSIRAKLKVKFADAPQALSECSTRRTMKNRHNRNNRFVSGCSKKGKKKNDGNRLTYVEKKNASIAYFSPY